MKINKKFLQFYASLLILIFHLWLPVTQSGVENFIIKTGYVGVDIFFFLSAYSLADKPIKYPEFIRNRFLTIYGKFLIFVIAAAVYKGVSVSKTIKILTLVEFFQRGGGSFLWFIPAIMIFYLLYPLFTGWKFRYKALIVLLAWLGLSFILDYFTGYTRVFIFTNRIPVIMLGYLVKTKKISIPKLVYAGAIVVGIALLYFAGYKIKLDIPFKDIYFVAGVVLTLGVCGISSMIPESKVWNVLGMGTLELYALQMICGANLVFGIRRIVNNNIITNIIVVVVMYAVSIGIAKLFAVIEKAVIGNIRKQ